MPGTCQRLAGGDGKQCCMYLPVTQSLALFKSIMCWEKKSKMRKRFDKCLLSAVLDLGGVMFSTLGLIQKLT